MNEIAVESSFVTTSTLAVWLFVAGTGKDWANYDFNLPSKGSPEVQCWRDSQTNRNEARFGMFIHWDMYSGLGNWFGCSASMRFGPAARRAGRMISPHEIEQMFR